jgi:hypothetical protein
MELMIFSSFKLSLWTDFTAALFLIAISHLADLSHNSLEAAESFMKL